MYLYINLVFIHSKCKATYSNKKITYTRSNKTNLNDFLVSKNVLFKKYVYMYFLIKYQNMSS